MDAENQLSKQGRGQRDIAIDGLRTIAVLLMIASHTSRLIVWDSRREWSRFSLLIEPLTASLFLVLVGASLVHSWRAADPGSRRSWFWKQSIRAGGLWALSCLFFTLEEGFHWPDALFLSGILATIAYSILLGMILVSLKNALPVLLGVCLALAGLENYLDQKNLQWFFVNAGNSPMLPLFLFACLGALGTLVLESRKPWVRPSLVAGAVMTLAYILYQHGLAEVFSKPLGRYDTVRVLVSGTSEVRFEKSIPYYNLRFILVPTISALIMLIYAGLALLRPILNPIARFLFRLGRYSLDVYILHLSLLAILVLTGGKRPLKSAWEGDAVLIGVIVLCYFWCYGRERFRKKLWSPRKARGDTQGL
jgi:Heparan-alpha-glucosaminide N-acetyltransferase, catalytic